MVQKKYRQCELYEKIIKSPSIHKILKTRLFACGDYFYHKYGRYLYLRWYTTKEKFFSDSSSIKMNFCHDVGGVPGTIEMICVSKLLS